MTSEFNPLLNINDIKIVEAAEIIYVQPSSTNPHVVAKLKSDDIHRKTQLSNIDGERYVKHDEIARDKSTITADLKANNTRKNVKEGHHFVDEIDSLPPLEPSAPPIDANMKTHINPEFKFEEPKYECSDYKSIYEDPNSLYKQTYGTEGSEYKISEYKSVYDH